MPRGALAGWLLALAGFAAVSTIYFPFVLDDAFITFRYAQNLADGHGLVWNPGEGKVEGYTSLLWVLVNAAGISAGLDPVVLSRVLSAAAAVALLWLIMAEGGRAHPLLGFFFAAGLAVSPSLSRLTWQGMETMVTTVLLTGVACSGVHALDGAPERASRRMAACWTFAFLALLCRPDTVPFLGAFMGTLAVLQGRRRTLRPTIKWGLAAVGAVGLYAVWRVVVLGQLLPNTFFVKMDTLGGGLGFKGWYYVWSHVTGMSWPYLLATAGLLCVRRGEGRLAAVAPVLIGFLVHLGYVMCIRPMQGNLWRYIVPAYGPFLWASVRLCRDWRPSRPPWVVATAAATVIAATAWSARHVQDYSVDIEDYRITDRVLAGKALAEFDGTLFTSESGALPFYSGWRSVDLLGLNSAAIAHGSLSLRFLDELNPDVVMVRRLGNRYKARTGKERVTDRFLAARGYVAAAAISKRLRWAQTSFMADRRGNPRQWHYYFVRADTPHFEEIVRRLQTLPHVRYGHLLYLLPPGQFAVHERGG